MKLHRRLIKEIQLQTRLEEAFKSCQANPDSIACKDNLAKCQYLKAIYFWRKGHKKTLRPLLSNFLPQTASRAIAPLFTRSIQSEKNKTSDRSVTSAASPGTSQDGRERLIMDTCQEPGKRIPTPCQRRDFRAI
jgi:hypothetical protein